MARDNPYWGKPIASPQMCDLMRRINALEKSLYKYQSMTKIGNSMFIANTGVNQVYEFSLATGEYVNQFGETGSTIGTLGRLTDIVTDGSSIYVADGSRKAFLEYNTSGVFQSEFATTRDPFRVDTDGTDLYYTTGDDYRVRSSFSGTVAWESASTGGGLTDIGVGDTHVFSPSLAIFTRSMDWALKSDGIFSVLATDERYQLGVGPSVAYFAGPVATSTGVRRRDESAGTIVTPEWSLPAGVVAILANKLDVFDGVLYVLANPFEGYGTLDRPTLYKYDTSGNVVEEWDLSWQTEWFGYNLTNKASLGTPDGGVLIPEDGALRDGTHLITAKNIEDMRGAVEILAMFSGLNFVDSDPLNLYYRAMGDRTAYGATGGAQYTWTRTLEEMENSPCYDIDIGEIYECVKYLEAA